VLIKSSYAFANAEGSRFLSSSTVQNREALLLTSCDTVTLPGQNPVLIDENFTEDLIPGCVINGVNPKLKDMSNFDYTFGKTYEFSLIRTGEGSLSLVLHLQHQDVLREHLKILINLQLEVLVTLKL